MVRINKNLRISKEQLKTFLWLVTVELSLMEVNLLSKSGCRPIALQVRGIFDFSGNRLRGENYVVSVEKRNKRPSRALPTAVGLEINHYTNTHPTFQLGLLQLPRIQ